MSTAPSATQSPKPKMLVISLIVSWVVLYILGFISHLQIGNSTADSFYKSLQLFHLHYHPEPETEHAPEMAEPAPPGPEPAPEDAGPAPPGKAAKENKQPEHPLTLELARFGAGLWGLALLPVLLSFLFGDRIFRWWVRWFWRRHVVVWGHCTRTLSLVRDLRRKKRRVVFLGHCPVPVTELPSRVCYIETARPDRALLAKAALKRACHFVALNENDRDNLELLLAAEAECADRKRPRPRLECHAHFGDTHLQNGLYRAFVSAPETARCTRRQLFNYYDHAARILTRQYPWPEMVPGIVPPREHFVLVGFGAFGQCVALKLVKMGQQEYQEGGEWRVVRPRLTVVDPRADEALEVFRRGSPHFADSCSLSSERLSCEAYGFLDLHFVRAGETTSIVFCLENEALTLRALLLLLDACRTSQKCVRRIYLRIGDPGNLGPLFETLRSGGQGPSVEFFASDREMFSADTLLHRSLDDMAKVMHESYREVEPGHRSEDNLSPAAGKPWNDLSDEDRDSNREAADHIWVKLSMLGYELHPVSDDDEYPEPEPRFLQELKDRGEDLARAEHRRWMTWRKLNGWRSGKPRDIDKKLHPDLVDYDDLPETTKEKDRAVVRAIPELLKKGRLRAERRKP